MKKSLTLQRRNELLATLKVRFEESAARHRGLRWETVQARLEANTDKLWSLNEMETSGGEPDVVGQDFPVRPKSLSEAEPTHLR